MNVRFLEIQSDYAKFRIEEGVAKAHFNSLPSRENPNLSNALKIINPKRGYGSSRDIPPTRLLIDETAQERIVEPPEAVVILAKEPFVGERRRITDAGTIDGNTFILLLDSHKI